MKTLNFILLIAISGTFTSCATLFSGTSDKITINSTPSGADVWVDGKKVGTTGNDIELKRKFGSDREVRLSKDGFKDDIFTMKTKIAGAFWLNIPTNFCLFCLFDIVTGAAAKPRDTIFTRTLTPQTSGK